MVCLLSPLGALAWAAVVVAACLALGASDHDGAMLGDRSHYVKHARKMRGKGSIQPEERAAADAAAEHIGKRKIIPVTSLSFYTHGKLSVDVAVGVPPLQFSLIIDTGSPNTLVVSPECDHQLCQEVADTYSPSHSRTFTSLKTAFLDTYTTGTTSGEIFQDHLAIGPMRIHSQHIGAIDTISTITPRKVMYKAFNCDVLMEKINICKLWMTPNFLPSGYAGVLGLGMPSSRLWPGTTTVLDNLREQNLIQSKEFAIYLEKNYTNGILHLGGVDPTYAHGKMIYFPLMPEGLPNQVSVNPSKYNSSGLWMVPISGLRMSKAFRSVCGQQPDHVCPAALASGTRYIWAPVHAMGDILDVIPDGQPCRPLHQYPILSFLVGDTFFEVRPEQYMIRNAPEEPGGHDICFSGILTHDSDIFVMGQPFFAGRYIHFDRDNNRIGISQAANLNERTDEGGGDEEVGGGGTDSESELDEASEVAYDEESGQQQEEEEYTGYDEGEEEAEEVGSGTRGARHHHRASVKHGRQRRRVRGGAKHRKTTHRHLAAVDEDHAKDRSRLHRPSTSSRSGHMQEHQVSPHRKRWAHGDDATGSMRGRRRTHSRGQERRRARRRARRRRMEDEQSENAADGADEEYSES